MNLMTFLINWMIAGIIGWAIWFIAAFIYQSVSIPSDDFTLDEHMDRVLPIMEELYRNEPPWMAVLRIIVWPVGIMHRTRMVISFVREYNRRF